MERSTCNPGNSSTQPFPQPHKSQNEHPDAQCDVEDFSGALPTLNTLLPDSLQPTQIPFQTSSQVSEEPPGSTFKNTDFNTATSSPASTQLRRDTHGVTFREVPSKDTCTGTLKKRAHRTSKCLGKSIKSERNPPSAQGIVESMNGLFEEQATDGGDGGHPVIQGLQELGLVEGTPKFGLRFSKESGGPLFSTLQLVRAFSNEFGVTCLQLLRLLWELPRIAVAGDIVAEATSSTRLETSGHGAPEAAARQSSGCGLEDVEQEDDVRVAAPPVVMETPDWVVALGAEAVKEWMVCSSSARSCTSWKSRYK
jgi:hypothetical protein